MCCMAIWDVQEYNMGMQFISILPTNYFMQSTEKTIWNERFETVRCISLY